MKLINVVTFYLGGLLFSSSMLSIFFSIKYYYSSTNLFLEWEIFSLGGSSMIMTFIFDWMSLSFMGLVLFISSMVMIYSTYYMEGDKFFNRFIFLVFLFVLSMVFLILSPNIISILLGWDGLGLVSYCLVIYYQNEKSANAGMITVLSNRVGDVAILLSISWLLNFGSWNFFYLQFMYNSFSVKILLGMMILAAMTKSAQIPFSAWLPAAMAAPTPVSALVHSSTLVTAGVYLLIRFNYLLGMNMFLFNVGVLTMFMSGLGANFEMDLKKIIALSTLSQLGLMMMTLSLGFYELSFFHLMTHAMFKSLLFLCAGVYIHSMGDIQDIRMMGGVMVACPIVSFYFMVASMALCGFPFLSGFYSKDMILEMFFMGQMNIVMFVLIFLATMFTLTYSIRLAFFIYINNFGLKMMMHMSEEKGMYLPMTFLVLVSVGMGNWMSSNLFPINLVYLPFILKIFIILMLTLIFFGLNSGLSLIFVSKKMINMCYEKNFFGSMWFLPGLSSIFFMPVMVFGEKLLKFVDQGWVEMLGGQGSIYVMKKYTSSIDFLNFHNLKMYLLLFFIMIIFTLSLI